MEQFIWELFKYGWWIEYIVSIFLAFIIFAVNIPKRKYFTLKTIGCFLFIVGVWLFRQIPGYNNQFDILFYFLIYALLFLTTRITLDVNFLQAVFVDTLVICAQHLCYKINFIFVILVGENFKGQLMYFVSYFIVTIFVNGAIYFIFSRQLKGNEIKTNKISSIVITPLVLISTIIINSYIQPVLLNNLKDQIIVSELINFYSILISFASIAILFQNIITNNLKDENYALALLSKKDKERYELAKITGEEIRIQYHDLKHKLDQEKLNAEEKAEFEETTTNYQSLVYSGSNSLDLILLEKQILAGKKGCHINAIVDGSLLSFMKPQHIYSMFSNLLDNAIEAASKLEVEDKKIVKLNVTKVKNNVLISIENYTNNSPKMFNGLPLTTKENKERHGYGMKSVKRTVERYNGILSVKIIDSVFIVKILFQYSGNEKTEDNA